MYAYKIVCMKFKVLNIYEFGIYALLNRLSFIFNIASAKPRYYIMIDFVIEAKGNPRLLAGHDLDL